MLSANRITGETENYELIPSSRIKFPYPREEEVGDPTLTAAQQSAEPEKAPAMGVPLNVQACKVGSPQPGTAGASAPPMSYQPRRRQMTCFLFRTESATVFDRKITAFGLTFCFTHNHKVRRSTYCQKSYFLTS